jgi:SAM-dependent methyltransferase
MSWIAACPDCRTELGAFGPTAVLRCPGCHRSFSSLGAVWPMVTGELSDRVDAFTSDYLAVRHGEGRGSDDPAWYTQLPSVAPDDPMAGQWRMRAISWRYLERHILPPAGAAIVDIGAGNGWLSRRLHERGDLPCSIDVLDDDRDGLGAAARCGASWPLLQAHFDRLPLADRQADVCIFNASVHYSTDLAASLAEAARVLRDGGRVVIVDSPTYRDPHAGAQMLAERAADFEQRFGTRSDAAGAIGFLTAEGMYPAGKAAGITWTAHRPWYGWRWAARPWAARLARRREPSRFVIWVGEVSRGDAVRS